MHIWVAEGTTTNYTASYSIWSSRAHVLHTSRAGWRLFKAAFISLLQHMCCWPHIQNKWEGTQTLALSLMHTLGWQNIWHSDPPNLVNYGLLDQWTTDSFWVMCRQLGKDFPCCCCLHMCCVLFTAHWERKRRLPGDCFRVNINATCIWTHPQCQQMKCNTQLNRKEQLTSRHTHLQWMIWLTATYTDYFTWWSFSDHILT